MKLLLVLIGVTVLCGCRHIPGNGSNPKAIEQVVAGERTVVNASWWGFDSEDATAALQKAIDSKATKVIVPDMGKPWIIRPIKLRGNLELVFEPGVLVLAKKDEFKGIEDSLLSASGQSDMIIRGYGAVLRMRKKDYQHPPYQEVGQELGYRHGLRLWGCKRVVAEGLRIESSGGDGIYLGSGPRGACEDVVIRDCISHDNHRQGISVIDARNLLLENCVFSGTDGVGPSAGIDFEPNFPQQQLVNCVVRNCIFENNSGHGIFVRPPDTFNRKSEPISIRIENCVVRMDKSRMGGDGGMVVRVPGDDSPSGLIEFINCTSENTGYGGAKVYGPSTGNLKVRFVNCRWKNSRGTPVELDLTRPSTKKAGGVEFVNCTVYDTKAGPAVQLRTDKGGDYSHDIQGVIAVHNKTGAWMKLKPESVKLNLRVIDAINKGQAAQLSAGVFGRTMGPLTRSAKDQPGYDDESTFGDLWQTHDFIADLPKTWSFKLDFKDEGQKQKWHAVDIDDADWMPIHIGEWWEPQGNQYDGIAWYRVNFNVPADAPGPRLILTFGAVDTSAWIYLNGKNVGEFNQDGKGWEKRFEVAIGDAVKIGTNNLLAVRVWDISRYGGIWKSVKLAEAKE